MSHHHTERRAPAETPTQKLPRFEGYSWRAINDEVRTYNARELRELVAECGLDPTGCNKPMLLELAFNHLRRIY